MATLEELIDHIDQPGIDSDPSKDISLLKPDITYEEALAVQLGVKRRKVAQGDRIIGHQGSFTSLSVREMFPDAPCPMFGTLLSSIARQDGDEVELDTEKVFIESEIAVLLKHDLGGENLSQMEVLAATEGFLPAIEVAPLRPGVLEKEYSWAHMIAVQKAVGGFVVFGSKLTSPKDFDPRLEGCLISMGGVPKAGATGYEAMGNPLTVVAALAAAIAPLGETLHAGQIIMTGSVAPPQLIGPSDKIATLETQTLGSVSVRIADR